MATASLKADVSLGLFFFSWLGGHKLLGGLILKESFFSFYFWWSGLNGVETAAAVVKDAAVTACGAHTCVSVCQLLLAAASCFSGTHG